MLNGATKTGGRTARGLKVCSVAALQPVAVPIGREHSLLLCAYSTDCLKVASS